MTGAVELLPLPGLPLVHEGDDLATLIADGLERAGLELRPGDVVVVAQKIVSKAEGRLVRLDAVTVGEAAAALAAETGKDPRLVQLILDESVEIVRKRPGTPDRPGVIIVEHRCGWVHANAGIDQSNLDGEPGTGALLLPIDCDASAAALRDALGERTGVRPGVLVCDSAGRAWRVGTVGMALGAAGVEAVQDLRGRPDLLGRTLEVTVVGRGDEIAAAAGLVMGQAGEGTPAVLVRGLPVYEGAATAAELVRPGTEDLFR